MSLDVADSLDVLPVQTQTIAGPDWTDPTGTNKVAIQVNTATGESALCWFDGSVWNRVVNQVSGSESW